MVDDFFDSILKLIGNPVYKRKATMFGDISHPFIIKDRASNICRTCSEYFECSAKLEIYIPDLGRLIYNENANFDIESIISILVCYQNIQEKLKHSEEMKTQVEFFRQLTRKVIDLNPHSISIYDNFNKLLYKNIAAKSQNPDLVKQSPQTAIPIYQSSEKLGQILFTKSQKYLSEIEGESNLDNDSAFYNIIGKDASILSCINIAKQVAVTSSTILILGESGTGKEIFAKAIHAGSNRGNEKFVVVNCAAIPENLIESELFGYVDGAFTDAKRGGKEGKILAAHKGTLFLDEIGDLPLMVQAKLLRVLQDKMVTPVGSLKTTYADVRIICATNRDLGKMVEEKLFREDLYYRINVIPIHLPPLRAKREDVTLLLHHYIRKYCVLNEKSFKYIPYDLNKKLIDYEWPGNVRELENVVEYAITMSTDDYISIDDLPLYLKDWVNKKSSSTMSVMSSPVPKQINNKKQKVSDKTRSLILDLIEKHGATTQGKRKVADEMGISLATLYRKIKKMEQVDQYENNR